MQEQLVVDFNQRYDWKPFLLSYSELIWLHCGATNNLRKKAFPPPPPLFSISPFPRPHCYRKNWRQWFWYPQKSGTVSLRDRLASQENWLNDAKRMQALYALRNHVFCERSESIHWNHASCIEFTSHVVTRNNIDKINEPLESNVK